MILDLVPLWAGILGLGVFMYVLLDGFDLGVGMLFAHAPDRRARDLMVNSVAPIWDGNETWLVLGGLALLSAFPVGFAVIMPALYFPILVMLIGLIFRGVAFEYRHFANTSKRFWDMGFHLGSLVATAAQGVVLGSFIVGFRVNGRQFAGSTFDWINPFCLLTAVGLMLGYGLLGACWLVLKSEGELQDWARRQARWLLLAVLVVMGAVSLWTPFLNERIYTRWFSWPNLLLLSPVPIVTAVLAYGLWWALERGRDLMPFVMAMAMFVMGYIGLAISLWPMIVPHSVDLWAAASSPKSQAFLMIGTLFLIPVILTYTGWSYWVFRGKVRGDVGYGQH
jgi:cytochrome d ubiquinol oxidase subunit II